jgi:type I restriction enzyme S subunit
MIIRDAFHLVGGGTPSTTEPKYWGAGVPWISSSDIDDFHNISVRRYVTDSGIEESATNRVSKGTVIVVTRVGLGKVALLPQDMCFSQDIQALVPKPNISINKRFVLFQLAFIMSSLKYSSQGTTISGITKKQLSDAPLFLPSLPEQERIVARIEELFSELDKGVGALQAVKAQLKVYRQAVLKKAFEGKLGNSVSEPLEDLYLLLQQNRTALGNRRQFSLLEQINLPELPAEWRWVCIGDIVSGCDYGTASKSSNTGNIPVIRMGNIQNGEIDWSNLVFSSDDADNTKYKLNPCDVLFNRTNSPEWVGKTAIYRCERPAIFAGYLIRINYLYGINPYYLTYFLNSPIARAYGKKVKTDGVNQSNINATKLCSYPFPLCATETQDSIVAEIESRLSVCDQVEKTVDESLAKAESLRQSILKKAFEGRL